MFANERCGAIHLHHGESPAGNRNRIAFSCVSFLSNPQCIQLGVKGAPIDYLRGSKFISDKSVSSHVQLLVSQGCEFCHGSIRELFFQEHSRTFSDGSISQLCRRMPHGLKSSCRESEPILTHP